jgi:hypothetical protein
MVWRSEMNLTAKVFAVAEQFGLAAKIVEVVADVVRHLTMR